MVDFVGDTLRQHERDRETSFLLDSWGQNALEQFGKLLHGLLPNASASSIASGKLKEFVPPQASPKDAEELARELIKQDVLTKFQATQVLHLREWRRADPGCHRRRAT